MLLAITIFLLFVAIGLLAQVTIEFGRLKRRCEEALKKLEKDDV